jgi:hypothetical protein
VRRDRVSAKQGGWGWAGASGEAKLAAKQDGWGSGGLAEGDQVVGVDYFAALFRW